MIQEATLVAEDGHALILEWNPVGFRISQIHVTAPAEKVGDINVNANSEAAFAAFSSQWGINLLDIAKSIFDGYSVGFVHTTKREVVDLDPKRGDVEVCVIHWFFNQTIKVDVSIQT